MRRSAAVQHLMHISSLGLGGGVAIPEMLDVLGDLVPGAFNSFFWLDRNGQLSDFYSPTIVLSAFEHLIVNYDQLRLAGEPTFDKILKMGPDVGAAGALHARNDYSRAVIPNEVWRPMGIGLGLDLILREGGEPRAILFVNREPRHSHFTPAEGRALLALQPYFLHALSSAAPSEQDVDDHEADVGVIVVDTAGAIVSMSPSGLQLMLEFMDVDFRPAAVSHRMLRELPPVLRAAVDRLGRLKMGLPSAPARIERRTRRGVYRAKAFPQAYVSPGHGDDCATLLLTRHLPRSAAVLRRLKTLDLSPRERQFAYQIGMGHSPDVASKAIGVSAMTARSYLKSIYRRLDIAGRPELVAALQTGRISA